MNERNSQEEISERMTLPSAGFREFRVNPGMAEWIPRTFGAAARWRTSQATWKYAQPQSENREKYTTRRPFNYYSSYCHYFQSHNEAYFLAFSHWRGGAQAAQQRMIARRVLARTVWGTKGLAVTRPAIAVVVLSRIALWSRLASSNLTINRKNEGRLHTIGLPRGMWSGLDALSEE
jgi:hypothetical protein